MPYFLSNENLQTGKLIQISGEEARHILLSHRVKIGEQIKLQGPDGKRFEAEVVKADKKSLTVKAQSQIKVPAEPAVQIVLFQSIVSEKALDFIFQKSTELGAAKIVLFNSANTATKLSADLFKKKKERWEKILAEAAKQSERAKWPSLEFAGGINQAIEKLKSFNKVFLADSSGQKISILSPLTSTLAIIIGPEGGFTQGETSTFKNLSNLEAISLGPITLRAETATLAVLAILKNLFP